MKADFQIKLGQWTAAIRKANHPVEKVSNSRLAEVPQKADWDPMPKKTEPCHQAATQMLLSQDHLDHQDWNSRKKGQAFVKERR